MPKGFRFRRMYLLSKCKEVWWTTPNAATYYVVVLSILYFFVANCRETGSPEKLSEMLN